MNVPLNNNLDTNPFYGRIIYTHGASIDQPLSVTRYQYVDLPAGGTHHTWPTFVLIPSWNAQGVATFGAFSNGVAYKQLVPGGTKCATAPATSPQRCVVWDWSGARTAYNSRQGYASSSFQGSLLEDKKDGAGTFYRRNRVYDPSTGRFTQEDPIGLAGGLNLYGFANGDPVNFSDPFGLWPDCKTADLRCLGNAWWEWRKAEFAREKSPDEAMMMFVGMTGARGAGGAMRSLTARNFRSNLAVETGESVGGAHAHHVLPREFVSTFNKAGLNAHDPRYGAWWEASDHLSNAGQYNAEWRRFLGGRARTADEILDFGSRISERYGIKPR